MNNNILTVATGQPKAPPISLGRVARAIELVSGGVDADEYTAAARSGRTWLGVRRLRRWCQDEGRAPLPASTDTLRGFLTHLARSGLRASTISTYLSAIRCWHRQAGHNVDPAPLYDLCKGIRRKAPAPHKAKPLMTAQLVDILDHLDPQRPGDCRDGAVLSLLFAGALRGAEVTALDWQRPGPRPQDLGSGFAGNAGYLAIVPKGIDVVLTSSKTSPTEPVPIPIPAQRMPRTIEWVQRWIGLARPAVGQPVFRSFTKRGAISSKRLTSAALTPIVRQRMREHLMRGGMTEAQALVEALGYSAHSCRAGFLSSAAGQGVDEWKLRERGRHKNADVAAGYVRLRSGWDGDWGVEI